MQRRILLLLSVACVVIAILAAQTPGDPDWQTAAGGKMAFEVASVKLATGPFVPPRFPLDNGDAYTPGDLFTADFPLMYYIQFAYKVRFSQQQRDSLARSRLLKWIESDRYVVAAKATSPATKDQIRLMMQALLADCFRLAIHFEIQQTAVMALTLVSPGKLGPRLHPHSEGPACEDPATVVQGRPPKVPEIFPPTCYVQFRTMSGGQLRAGSRNTIMDQLAEALLTWARLDRPVVDQTGYTARIDYDIEWTPQPTPGGLPDANPPDDAGPTFLEALREQLGMRLEATKLPLRVLVIDHVERPSEN